MKQSTFVERAMRLSRNVIYQHLENKLTYQYIKKLLSFVNTMNSRVNRFTRMEPNKVTKRHVPNLISLPAECSKFAIDIKVRMVKDDSPFKKLQSLWRSFFYSPELSILNPRTYFVGDESRNHLVNFFNSLNLQE